MASRARYQPAALANLLGVSLRTLERSFRTRASLTPRQWLNELRLREAATRLGQGEKMDVVAKDLGYFDRAHLCHSFRRRFKCTPKRAATLVLRNLPLAGKLRGQKLRDSGLV